MKKVILAIIVTLLLMGAVMVVEAANIHIRYFESADVILTEDRFQIFSFSALEDEKATIVAYGLEEGIVPGLTVLDPTGVTMAEDLNADQLPVAVAEITAPENGIYTFLVSRQNDVGGLMRVMLFVGDPLGDDLTLLDTVDPFLPSRAYLVAGDDNEPVEMTIRIMLDEEDDTSQPPTVFASRGTEVEVAPLEERVNPVQQFTWFNDDGDIFYTLNVRPLPEPVPTTLKGSAVFAPRTDVTDLEDLEFVVGEGGDPQEVPRPVCVATALPGAEVLAGPGDDYLIREILSGGEEFEIVGENGAYVQVVDLDDPSGASWILKEQLNLPDLLGEDCVRVQFVNAPELTNENRRGEQGGGDTGGSDGGETTGGDTGFADLPPGGNPPPDTPTTDGSTGGDDSGVGRPPPPPPGSDTGGEDPTTTTTGGPPPCDPEFQSCPSDVEGEIEIPG